MVDIGMGLYSMPGCTAAARVLAMPLERTPLVEFLPK